MRDLFTGQRLAPETHSAGIIIPDTAQEKNLDVRVLAVGPGKRDEDGERIPLDVRPGELVRIGQWTDFEDDRFVIAQEADIRFILNAR